MKGLGLALACFSDIGRDGMDKSMPSIWSKHSASKGLRMAFTNQVQVLITPPNRPLGFSCGLSKYEQAGNISRVEAAGYKESVRFFRVSG